jgi:hypothetical protein
MSAHADTDAPSLDHILWATPDLDAGCALFAALSGVIPAIGGAHPGLGTRNALASLGDGLYLEIIAPDPAQSLSGNLGARIAAMREPGVIAFALRASNLAGLAEAARLAGAQAAEPAAMSRLTPTGETISWSILHFHHAAFEGAPHFAIDWGTTPHPSTRTPTGCRLARLAVLRPDPAALQGLYGAMHCPVEVAAATRSGFLCELTTPRGRLVLR